MRISSNTLFNSSAAAMSQQQSRLLQTNQQIASGRKLLTASDDPVASARILDLSEADKMNTQYTTNRKAALHTLSTSETVLDSVTSLILDVRDIALDAGSTSSLTDSMRQGIASGLSGKLEELMGLANSTDGLGHYLYSGYQSKTQPFADLGSGVLYEGDDGQRLVQVSSGRQMPSSDSGADIFMRIRNGNGAFVTQPDPTSHAGSGNSGTGVISAGNVVDRASLTGDDYQISFTVAAGVTTYSITDTTTSALISAGNPYVSGQAISFDGMQFDIKGVPADGDQFAVEPSVNQSLFTTISNLIAELKKPVDGDPAAAAKLSGELAHGIKNLDNAHEKVLATRATLGIRLNEIDALQVTGDDLDLQFKTSLSELQDIDYIKALSDLSMYQTSLEAAQKSFVTVTGLSLFNYI